ncbi:MAG: chemotaxis-specific protein-glutamate methyltransferase CheB [Deltaproteobacteria bacterium]|nr:chemotaxis-specific protein-glutamate methyltransferase CheB [Deltaproteobacteria bacterium]
MMVAVADRSIRVLVVDDSVSNRKEIVGMLRSTSGEFAVIGEASNGEEALRLALEKEPQAITLDLEMPVMDGFTFLRILMAQKPIPVIIVSSYANQQNVFKALELGAVDFIAKPPPRSGGMGAMRQDLFSKLRLVRSLRIASLDRPRARKVEPAGLQIGKTIGIVAVGASTGGPSSLLALFERLPPDLPLAYLVAQHMPPSFTRAFAERLDHTLPLKVTEADGGERIEAGRVYIAPGGKNLTVEKRGDSLVVRVSASAGKYVPSIDALFESAAKAVGPALLAIVLTGMGDDGSSGVLRVKSHGGRILAESEKTAVIFGMPGEAVRTGQVDRICRLDEMPEEIVRFARRLSDPSAD